MSEQERMPEQRTWADEQLLFAPHEAARILGIGRTTLYALMGSGDIRPVHIGRSCRISRAEIRRYVARIDAPPPPQSPPQRPPRTGAATAANQGGPFDTELPLDIA